MNNALGEIVLIVILILLNGFFSAAEIALLSARKSKLMQKAEDGSRSAEIALELSEDSTLMISTVQIGITLVGMLSSAIAAVTLATPLANWLGSLGFTWITPVASGLAVLLVTLIVSYLTLVFGELVPKRIGIVRAERAALFVARPVAILATIARPIVTLLTASTRGVEILIGMKDDVPDDEAAEEEIKLMVTEQDSLLDEEKNMIHEIFDLGDTVAREIMVPRVDMMFIEDTESVLSAAELLSATGFSRVPVFHDDHDKIVGVVFLKDLVIPLSEGKGEDPVTTYMREPVFIPETKDLLPLLSEMQTTRNQMTIVVDEHGGTAGIVTMEDIVEEIVGEISDEFDRDKADVMHVSEYKWVIEGKLPVEDAIDLGFPMEESDEYDTSAGWLLEHLGHIPHTGEKFEHEGFTFTVQGMRRRRIARIRIEADPDAIDALSSTEVEGVESHVRDHR